MKWVWITIKEVGFSSNQLTFESPHPPAALLAPVHKWDCPCKKGTHRVSSTNLDIVMDLTFQLIWKNESVFMCMCLASPGLRTFHYFFLLVSYVNNIKTNLFLGKISWHKWKQSLWSMNLLPYQNSFEACLVYWSGSWDGMQLPSAHSSQE